MPQQQPQNQNWVLSIDFGTSNTAAAHTNQTRGTVEALNLSHNRMTMPSSVYVETPEHLDTGDVALNKAEANPSGFIPAPKRQIDREYIQANGYSLPLATPVAAVLESVVRKAEREHNNQRPSELVLTHPEAWTEAEIKVLLDAAAKLGLKATSIRTVSEPQAAAHYYSASQPLEPGDKIAVFDFGGGTLDVAVLEAQQDGSFNIVAARGDNSLGGKSFDALIRRWVDAQLEDDYPDELEYLRRAPLSQRHAVEDSIRRAKELLSEAPSATITIPGEHGPISLQLTRSEFEGLIQVPLSRAVDVARATLADASVQAPADLKALYLTGGSSRVPIVQEALKELGPIATLDDPKMVVAQGAISAATPVVTGLKAASDQPAAHGGSSRVDTPPVKPAAEPETATFPKAESGRTGAGDTAVNPAVGTAEPEDDVAAAPRKRRTGLAAAATAAILALVGGGIWAVSSGGGGQDEPEEPSVTQTETIGQTDAGAASSEEASPSSTALSSADDIYDALPQDVRDSTTGCNLTSGSLDGPAIRCDMDSANKAGQFFAAPSPYTSSQVTFAVSTEQALRERAAIKNGTYRGGEPTEGADGNALAVAEQSGKYGTSLHYANKETGLIISSNDFASPEAAMDWLRHFNLL